MESFNMRGRWYRARKKATVDDYLQLDIVQIAREVSLDKQATLAWAWMFADGTKAWLVMHALPQTGIELLYTYRGARVEPYVLPLVYTRPHFGGHRPWFLCPACRKRVRILYGKRYFRCRDCRGLTYPSRQESRSDVPLGSIRRRKRAILMRLGSGDDTLPPRPPFMHVKTYLALLEEYWQLAMLEDEALTAMIAQFDTLTRPRRVNVRAEWQRLKAQRKQPLALLRAAAQRASWRDSVAATEPAEKRVTLGELAKQARVPYAFAKEAAQTPLLRPDQGRTTRRKRYRRGLARWLNKLYQLRTAGMTWNEIEAWTKRRWQPGRDHERYWPRDYG